MPLNDTRVRTLTTGNRAERLVVDTNGLYLRLRKGKGGISRTWQFRRREAGNLSVVTLGTYPDPPESGGTGLQARFGMPDGCRGGRPMAR